jgi:O-antigen/teichoic acid export membrane protein
LGLVQWVGSAILVYFGYGLTAIIGLLVVARIILALVSFALLRKMVGGGISLRTAWDGSLVRSVFRFGGWIAVSQILAPLFQYFDRILIGAMLTLTAVAYYTVPQEIVSRLLVFPLSLTLVLFPMLSSGTLDVDAHNDHSGLYKRSIKYLFSLVFPLTLLAIALAPEFLRWWVGEDFASHSEVVFQVLSAGFFFNALAQLPATALQAAGLPDVTAKIHLLEVVPTIIVLIVCIFLWGLIGAAMSWSVRAFGDCVLLFIAARRKIPNVARNSMAFLTHSKVVLHIMLLTLLVVVAMLVGAGGAKIGLLSFAVVVYLVSLWFVVFDDLDRTFFLQLRARAFRKGMVE